MWSKSEIESGGRQTDGDREAGSSLHRHRVQKELVSPDKIIWLFSATPGGDMPFTWREPCERVIACVRVNYIHREKIRHIMTH